jgi:hypothetical protein
MRIHYFHSFFFLGKQFEKLFSFHQKVDELRLSCGKSNDEVTQLRFISFCSP